MHIIPLFYKLDKVGKFPYLSGRIDNAEVMIAF